MPDAKSIHSRPSTSVSVPPLAWSTYDVSTELTPRATAADRRLPSSSDDVISDLDVVHDVLDPGVVLETVHGQVLAVSGALEAAVRHLGDERDVCVDPDAAEVETVRHPHRPAMVACPHRGCEAVLHAIRPPDRLLLVGEALHGDDRA